MRGKPFPADSIEATSARIKYGLNPAAYRKLAPQLDTWRLESADYHSEGQLRGLIKKLARFVAPSSEEAA